MGSLAARVGGVSKALFRSMKCGFDLPLWLGYILETLSHILSWHDYSLHYRPLCTMERRSGIRIGRGSAFSCLTLAVSPAAAQPAFRPCGLVCLEFLLGS